MYLPYKMNLISHTRFIITILENLAGVILHFLCLKPNFSKGVYYILVLYYGTLCPQIYETVLVCSILSPVLRIIY